MAIKVGDRLPNGTLNEFIEVEKEGCTIGPNTFKVEDMVKGKKIAVFGLPGAFTPTCSAKHVPGFVENAARLKAARAQANVFDGASRLLVAQAPGHQL